MLNVDPGSINSLCDLMQLSYCLHFLTVTSSNLEAMLQLNIISPIVLLSKILLRCQLLIAITQNSRLKS